MPSNKKKRGKAKKAAKRREQAAATGGVSTDGMTADQVRAMQALSVKARASGSGTAGTAEMSQTLRMLKMKYTLLGKEEWWWLFDDTLEAIGKCLTRDSFCVLDGFVLPQQVYTPAPRGCVVRSVVMYGCVNRSA